MRARYFLAFCAAWFPFQNAVFAAGQNPSPVTTIKVGRLIDVEQGQVLTRPMHHHHGRNNQRRWPLRQNAGGQSAERRYPPRLVRLYRHSRTDRSAHPFGRCRAKRRSGRTDENIAAADRDASARTMRRQRCALDLPPCAMSATYRGLTDVALRDAINRGLCRGRAWLLPGPI